MMASERRPPTLVPVVQRGLRAQLRGRLVPVLLSLYLGVLLGALAWFHAAITAQVWLGTPLVSAQIGQALFTGLGLGVQVFVVFLAPATTINALSSEYEQHGMDLLQMTPLATWHVVLGKLLSGLALLLLLLLLTVPLLSLVLLFGGVTLLDMGRLLLTVLCSALLGCALGLCCSALLRQTYTATLVCYALLVVLVGGTFFAARFWQIMQVGGDVPSALVVINPLSAIAAALSIIQLPPATFGGLLEPLALLGMLSNGVIEGTGQTRRVLPVFRATWLLYGLLSLLLVWLTLHAARPRGVWRFTREDAIISAVVLVYGGLGFLVRAWWLPGLS